MADWSIDTFARELNDACNSGDAGRVLLLVQPDADVELPGRGRRRMRGHDEITSWLERRPAVGMSNTVVMVERLSDQEAIVMGRSRHEASAGAAGEYVVWLIETRDGLLARVRVFPDRRSAHRAYAGGLLGS